MAAIKLAGGRFLGFVTLWVLLYREKVMQVRIHTGPEIGVASTKALQLKLQY
jgi:glucosamine 6-phosphate synthetase-like amidotransferase/phosphosugar isomerase protein